MFSTGETTRRQQQQNAKMSQNESGSFVVGFPSLRGHTYRHTPAELAAAVVAAAATAAGAAELAASGGPG